MTYSLDTILQLENTPEFNNLDQQFNEFNPFKILRVDPYENHRLGVPLV